MLEHLDSPPSAELQARAAELGAQPAIIERFGIRGLYGYRTIALSSRYAATVLIAKNGTGKTTLMGALDAFLKLQLNRLRGLEFDEIFCRLQGVEEEIILKHRDLVEFLQPPKTDAFARVVSRTGIEQQKMFDFILSDFKSAFANYYNDHDSNSIVNVIGRNFNHNISSAQQAVEDAYFSLFSHNDSLRTLYNTVTSRLKMFEIVYLPTYRRVELALTDDGEQRRRNSRGRTKLSIKASGLYTSDIQFGLGDISDRLSDLNEQIISRSNRGYRELSENIIHELIKGFEVSDKTKLPEPSDLKLFFSRLESGNRVFGPYSSISAPDFERIYSGEGVPPESQKFLTYFLGKLNNIIDITAEIEQPVGDFIVSCNKYLSSPELSTLSPEESPHQRLIPIDAKELVVDRNDLSVHVESVPARTPISLDALSSGEKQMVSLFAKMYLYPKKKIVLIDEPELSLSIDWQRGILIDVLLSPQCAQIVAITHSPFVFDNALEPFARTLELSLAEHSEPQLSLDTPVDAIEGARE